MGRPRQDVGDFKLIVTLDEIQGNLGGGLLTYQVSRMRGRLLERVPEGHVRDRVLTEHHEAWRDCVDKHCKLLHLGGLAVSAVAYRYSITGDIPLYTCSR